VQRAGTSSTSHRSLARQSVRAFSIGPTGQNRIAHWLDEAIGARMAISSPPIGSAPHELLEYSSPPRHDRPPFTSRSAEARTVGG
jgi:hypothetical protein